MKHGCLILLIACFLDCSLLMALCLHFMWEGRRHEESKLNSWGCTNWEIRRGGLWISMHPQWEGLRREEKTQVRELWMSFWETWDAFMVKLLTLSQYNSFISWELRLNGLGREVLSALPQVPLWAAKTTEPPEVCPVAPCCFGKSVLHTGELLRSVDEWQKDGDSS